MSSNLKIKTCIFGNSSVGKTSIILRIHEGVFNQKVASSVGIDFKSETKKMNGEEVIVELWDTTGQEKYRSVVTNFSKDSKGMFLVFDLTQEKSLPDLQYWLAKIYENVPEDVPKVLLGNKVDIKKELSEDQQKKVKELCEKHKMSFFKVSAKTGYNVKEAYNSLLEEAYNYSYSRNQNNGRKTTPVLIQSRIQNDKDKKGCC